MSAIISPSAINGVSLTTRAGKLKSRYSEDERLRILGATKADLDDTINLFCPDRPHYSATRRHSQDPRDWMTPVGRLPDSEVLRHLTGNLTPGINPRWVAPHSWEVTWWIGIDVDYRGDRVDFERRCEFVIQALGNLGVPRVAILKSLTPSGGRHYRFFTTEKVHLRDIPRVMALVGLHESSGQIEIFPKLNKGMRLPFGFIPEREHDPQAWLRFIRAYRRRKFPRVSWQECSERASQHATAELERNVDGPSVNGVDVAESKSQGQCPRITRMTHLGIPKVLRTTQPGQAVQSKDRYMQLLSRPFTNPSEAIELWHLGICAEGTRNEATKRMAWHLLFVKGLDANEAASQLVKWVYETGCQTSKDVRNDNNRGTRKVEEDIRRLVQRLVDIHTPTDAHEKDLSRFSMEELRAIIEKLGETKADDAVISVALSFLRFAKLRGNQQNDGWTVQVAVNGVIRKWPECRGMKYKPLIEALKKCGLIEMTREKRQSANGTGRPRTYLVRVRPELRTGAGMSREEALQSAAQLRRSAETLGMTAHSSTDTVNTYRRSIPPTSSEEMRKLKGVAGQERIQDGEQLKSQDGNPTAADLTVFRFRQAVSAGLAELMEHNSTSTSTGPWTDKRSSSDIRLSSRPMDQMSATDNIFGRGTGRRHLPRRFRQRHKPRQDDDLNSAFTLKKSLDGSLVST